MSDIKTARPRMPSPLTGAIVVSLLIFKVYKKPAYEEKECTLLKALLRSLYKFKLSFFRGEFK